MTGYDPVAAEYAATFFGELEHKPFDRRLLDTFAARVRGWGPACDLGCGPGQVARYLRDRGADAFGLDLSPALAREARRLSPDVPFAAADLRALPARGGAWGGVAAFYSLIHLPRGGLTDALREIRRALKPGGPFLMAYHIGDETVHRDEWWGKPVSLDFTFFPAAEVEGGLRAAGFVVESSQERAHYEGVEFPSRRGYALARKPDA